MACQYYHLCAGLKVGIDGAVHIVQAIWDGNSTTEDWIFLLVDAKNAFKNINGIGILWTVRHLWPSGARFVFTFYRHWSSLILRNGNGTFSFMHSKEGVTQGDPLAMIAYSIGILPLIKNLKREIPDVTQPWYTDDAGALGMFAIIDTSFNSLTRQGPGRIYYPEPSKSVLIIHLENLEAVKEFRERHVFKVCTGARYLGGYIRGNESNHNCMIYSTLTWENNNRTIRKTAGEYP